MCVRRGRSSVPFCSLAVLDPKVGHTHTMDVYYLHLSLSSVILIDSSMKSPVHVLWLSNPSRSCVAFLACVQLALFLALSISPGNSIVSSWYDHSMLAVFVFNLVGGHSAGGQMSGRLAR